MRRLGVQSVCAVLVMGSLCAGAHASPQNTAPVNSDSSVLQAFETRVTEYFKLRQKLQSNMPATKTSNSAANIKGRQALLAAKIKSARADARQGDIFTPEASAIIRRLIATPLNSADGARIRASLANAEPVKNFRPRVNQEYPAGLSLQSTPPSLLIDLPRLPQDMEYRIVGHDLILRDAAANIIVDLMPQAIPAP